MNLRFPLLSLLTAAGMAHLQAQNAAPVVLDPPLANATVYTSAGSLTIDLTTAFQDPDMAKAVRLTTVEGAIDFALYDRQKPITATNFLRYVNEGRYFMIDPVTAQTASSFIHRAPTNFVLQGGGFIGTVNPADPAKELARPTQVSSFAPIQNEPGISNRRGTVAMAKTSQPNSATSQWFINVKDNINLDDPNVASNTGGFTVFGRVIGDGMNVVDRIAGLPIGNFGGSFTELPVRGYSSPNPVRVANLVSIPQIVEIAPVPSPLNFTTTADDTNVLEAKVSGNKLLVRGLAPGNANVTVTATDLDGASISQTFAVSVVINPSRFANIATRMEVRPDPNALIGGFFIRGDSPKRVIVRATMPTGLSNTLADPQLQLFNGAGEMIASNDNWGDATKQDIIDSGLKPETTKESAIIATLPASSTGLPYTAIVRGANDGIGIALVEVYDLDSGPGSSLVNIATRGRVDDEPKVMIGGFIITGAGTKRVLLRALAPSLPVSGTLSNPRLQLFNANGQVIAENDDWQNGPDRDEIANGPLAPPNSKESALIQTLSPAAFTAVVSGVNGAKGVATVEAYQLD